MASILVGVAVIPAQAASLFEALLEFQTERRQSQSVDIKNQTQQPNTNIEGGVLREENFTTILEQQCKEGNLLDSRISCRSCGARSHRIDAIYCFSCGAKL